MTRTVTGWERLAQPFARRASSGSVIREVDGLRFVAITWVLLFHLTGSLLAFRAQHFSTELASWLRHLALNGHYGVELFFVISGFVLGLPFARAVAGRSKWPSLSDYLRRRATRLEPPYLLNLVILFILLRATRPWNPELSVSHLLASATYLHGAVYGAPSTINAVAWSLEIEIQFYLIVPLVARVYRLENALTRLVVFVAAITALTALRVLVEIKTGIVPVALLAFLQYFLVGMALADVYVSRWNEAPSKSSVYDLVAFASWPALLWQPGNSKLALIILPWLLGALFISALRGNVGSRLFSTPFITIVGSMCYTLYLYHYVILVGAGKALLWRIAPTSDFTTYVILQFALAFIVTVGVGALLFLCFERPFMTGGWRRAVGWTFARVRQEPLPSSTVH
jgi:peptidoglycan/LPS O-acetylase OafA/YrhL